MDAALSECEALGRMRDPEYAAPRIARAMRGAKGKLRLGKPDAVGWHHSGGGGGTTGGGDGSLGGEIKVPIT